ncbi:Tma19p KNAG_0A07250 [Huiozyma naganishii CBS 8797]|uniref:Translationally-controlled tumor protein homolog n=1 Tax=Huiozyma naganishii (strain ATCC MYA-139 / BCRC 22969 / CBS 8797 / KCTC 17520 / NBRC 10181 / NCYC 3082 / Yp74L-3) TaxID=1071383 RepID=J7RFQ8_HUIN7|nr:hypothetical protein KNAG_0A07250 [Kazachstania naganishii CBS 8797]CCK68378.1 hypothetical protein KNAG_0A07250 [Kazachstania naganishii CBS 8797]
MKIYKDIISNDELLSDAYDLQLVDGVIYEADCVRWSKSVGTTSISVPTHPLKPVTRTLKKVLRLSTTLFTLSDCSQLLSTEVFLTYIKGYMKSIKAKLQESNPDEVATFEKGAQTYVKKVIGSFKDWEFYTGESMDPDAMILMLNYREDGTTPFVAMWKHGVVEEKI